MSDSKSSSFTIDTYFIITIVAGILWIILRKFWDTYQHSLRHKKTIKSLSHTESIPSIIQSITQIMEQVQSIKNNTETIIKNSVCQSISEDLEAGVQ